MNIGPHKEKTPKDNTIKNWIRYSKKTGKLFWKKRRCVRVRVGDEIYNPLKQKASSGSTIIKTHLKVMFSGKLYQAKHVAWFLHYGRWPKKELIQIDKDYRNVRISNLKEVTRSEAMQHAFRDLFMKLVRQPSGKYLVTVTRSHIKVYEERFDSYCEALFSRYLARTLFTC
jgi:hypothetical protein